MPESNGTSSNKWTIMFFFASDNPLSPLLISQLKEIKDAGFQEDTEVLVYFDPMEKGAATCLFNVNNARKQREPARNGRRTCIGDGTDSFVRKMDEDRIDPVLTTPAMNAVLTGSPEPTAFEALQAFIEFGTTKHRAENYMLFLVGHGMLVGNDAFLPDEDPISAISLQELRRVLEPFKAGEDTLLRLLGLHSCSMSSVEVAYELKGSSDFMIATQGNAFVNAWPYRQLLKKTLNAIEKARSAQVNVTELIEKLFFHSVHNATDFISAGYSADLSLVSLGTEKLEGLKSPVQELVRKLKANMYRVNFVKNMVLLAHWEAQSFFEENYTDLFDFCFCLSRLCMDEAGVLQSFEVQAENPSKEPTTAQGKWAKELRDVASACDEVIKVLAIVRSPHLAERFNGLIIHEENFGSLYQYARGLSVYFPWSEPRDDDPVSRRVSCEPRDSDPKNESRSQSLIEKYKSYSFTTEFEPDSWFSFLSSYWESTKRLSRLDEEGMSLSDEVLEIQSQSKFTSDDIVRVMNEIQLNFTSAVLQPKKTPELKKTPEEGVSCSCPSIKNYPTDSTRRTKKFSITPGALRPFLFIEEPEEDQN